MYSIGKLEPHVTFLTTLAEPAPFCGRHVKVHTVPPSSTAQAVLFPADFISLLRFNLHLINSVWSRFHVIFHHAMFQLCGFALSTVSLLMESIFLCIL